jgi:hypothetical protein
MTLEQQRVKENDYGLAWRVMVREDLIFVFYLQSFF